MEIIVPSYIKADTTVNHLKNHGAFQYGKYWNANVLTMPGNLGVGNLLVYIYEQMHIIRGKWKFNESTSFHSLDHVKLSKQIDFRITADGGIHSAFLEGHTQYSRDISNGDEIKLFLPKDCIGDEVKLLDKIKKYCIDKNVAGFAKQLFSLGTDNTTSLILLEGKLLEFTHLWIEFLNKKDIEKHFEGFSDFHLRLLMEAKNLIEQTIHHPYSIKELSKKIGLNEVYLKSGFKKLTGFTIHQYIIHLRMEKARKLILNSDLPIGEISDMLGYSNRGHFSQVYLKYFGILPHASRPRMSLLSQ